MVETEKTKSGSTKESGGFGSMFSCCNFETMTQMMKKFCEEKDKTFDCCTMMQKMCSMDSKSGKQE